MEEIKCEHCDKTFEGHTKKQVEFYRSQHEIACPILKARKILKEKQEAEQQKMIK